MPYEYYAKVLRVLDGDTIECVLDLGFDIHLGPRTVRFFGLNAPEIHDTDPAIKAKAQAAMDFVTAKLLPADPALTPTVKLQTQKPDSTDKFGRLLATIFYLPPKPAKPVKPVKGSVPPPAPTWGNLNEESMSAGLTKPYFGEGVKPV